MKLPVKITFLLFTVVALFVSAISIYFYRQIERNFRTQADRWMAQSSAFVEQRLTIQEENLRREMEQLASAFFLENENTLSLILGTPTVFNTDVVNFAEKLRRRTTLDFLYVISADSTVLSNSLQPAAFGKSDPRSDFPFDRPAYVYDSGARLELKKTVRFGNRTIFLRGGYSLKPGLRNLALPGIQAWTQEINPASAPVPAPSAPGEMTRLLKLNDYNGKPVAAILLIASQTDLNRQKGRLINNSITFIVITLFICLVTGYLLSLWISRPVARLQSAAEEMSRGNLGVRVVEGGSGEIAALMSAFNRMAEQLQEKQEKLIQSERIAAWEEIARHLAHEIKNPLTPIRTSLTNLRLCMEKAPEKFLEIFLESSENITEEVEKLRHLADEFSKFARLPALKPRPANLNEVVQKAILLHRPGTPNGIVFEPGDVPVFPFDPEQISQVLHNLLKNATEAIGPDGMIKIATGTVHSQGKEWSFLVVEDNGAGMDEHVRRQMFTPYFTTKEKGTGLGLAIVHRIIYEHGGSILIDSAPGQGARFEIRLPVEETMNAER